MTRNLLCIVRLLVEGYSQREVARMWGVPAKSCGGVWLEIPVGGVWSQPEKTDSCSEWSQPFRLGFSSARGSDPPIWEEVVTYWYAYALKLCVVSIMSSICVLHGYGGSIDLHILQLSLQLNLQTAPIMLFKWWCHINWSASRSNAFTVFWALTAGTLILIFGLLNAYLAVRWYHCD